jgi:hypothetical protein
MKGTREHKTPEEKETIAEVTDLRGRWLPLDLEFFT